MEFYRAINKELAKKYGKDLAGNPMYKVVQNINLTEKRKGQAIASGILLPHQIEYSEVPKYRYIPEGHWILEKLFYTDNPELVSKITYEPLWHFIDQNNISSDNNFGYQRPNLRACILIIETALKGPQEVETQEQADEKAEQEIYESLGGDATPADYIHSQEGVSLSGPKFGESEAPVLSLEK